MKKTYEQEIEALIPLAETAANKATAHLPSGRVVEEVWNRVFHSIMDRLAVSRGIRRMTWQA